MAKKTKASSRQLTAGIAAVLGGKKIEPNTVAMIPINKIARNADQPRTDFDSSALKELSESLMIHGLIQPITVRSMGDGTYEIISGERRWRASQLAKLTQIPAYVRTANDQEMLEMALVENIQREDLNPVEMATSLARLKEEFKLTDDDVANKIGKKRSTISGYLGVLTLSPNIIESLRGGDISMGHAKSLSSLDRNLAQTFYTKTIENGWSVRSLEDALKIEKEKLGIAKKAAKPKTSLPTEYQTVLDSLRARFGSRKINIKLKPDGQGQIVLPFTDTDELNRFLDTIEGE
jgi:ParB family chromosome partitioning protein